MISSGVTMVPNHRIILSSGSPRRKELLAELGIDFSVDTDNSFVEKCPKHITPKDVPLYMAKGKSDGFHRKLEDDEILITADTVVIVDDMVLGKPHDKTQAVDMLKMLSDRAHEVITAVVLRSNEKTISFSDVTRVFFSEMSEDEINYYIDNYKPFDKAGAYGIQEWIGLACIEKIDGSYFNVMGLPVHRIHQALKLF